jgi:UDP-N-acetyl-D-mannosaminuronic acid dehydrogenase
MSKAKQNFKIAIIGGCGHVGLPLGVKFALTGAETVLIDINQQAVDQVNGGSFPFLEKGGDAQLVEALKCGLKATTDISACDAVNTIVFVTGTPVDEHLNPKVSEVINIFESYKKYFSADKLIVMRSTLAPGTMEYLKNRVEELCPGVKLAFCPERVAQGYALDEIDSLPQIVSAFNDQSFEAACDLFSLIAPTLIKLKPLEAELTKLMANAWRYMEFAISNQFYTIAEKNGVDFYRILQAIKYDYPRAKSYKSAGFAAGPCLFKDTMQLASYFDNQFHLGHSAMLVNEGLATVAVDKAEAECGGSLVGKTVGILGLAFKADNDDTRESLSFKVRKGLDFRGASVLLNDPFVEGTVSLEEVLAKSDVLVLCAPHSAYKKISISQPVVDVWGFFSLPELEIIPGRNSEVESNNKVINK